MTPVSKRIIGKSSVICQPLVSLVPRASLSVLSHNNGCACKVCSSASALRKSCCCKAGSSCHRCRSALNKIQSSKLSSLSGIHGSNCGCGVCRTRIHGSNCGCGVCRARINTTGKASFSSSTETSSDSQAIKEEVTAEATTEDATTEEFAAEESEQKSEEVKDVLIEETEKAAGPAKTHTFKAETKRLLEIVAKSLYSEKEVFIRELISNASDALEKLRHLQISSAEGISVNSEMANQPLEIRISLDDKKGTFTIQDTGIGMTEEQLNDHLGTIAKSGSLQFVKEESKDKEGAGSSSSKDRIIGQFGVGFYSALMVGENIRVYTRSAKEGSKGYLWKCDGSGSYEICEAEGVSIGTKIVIDLKKEDSKFSTKSVVEGVINKYSHFVEYPVLLNGHRVNKHEPLWTREKSSISDDDVKEFYKFFFKDYSAPKFHLIYKTDSPMNIRSIFFAPEVSPWSNLHGIESEISLYSRKVLITNKCKDILPNWLRFMKGIVDSEDIPLNLSREILQNNGHLIGKLRDILSKRIIRWLKDEANMNPESYKDFYRNCSYFIKEGVCTDKTRKKDIMELLRFESSTVNEEGAMVSLEDYVKRMKEGQKDIYYLVAPNRDSAMESPYLEPFIKKGYEVLFMYQEFDQMVGNSLEEYSGKSIKNAEKVGSELEVERSEESISDEDAKSLCSWIKEAALKDEVSEVSTCKRFTSYPIIVVDHENFTLMRRLMQNEKGKPFAIPHKVEINAHHPLIKKLLQLRSENPEFATTVVQQMMDNALLAAGVLENPRRMLKRVNNLLERLVLGTPTETATTTETLKDNTTEKVIVEPEPVILKDNTHERVYVETEPVNN